MQLESKSSNLNISSNDSFFWLILDKAFMVWAPGQAEKLLGCRKIKSKCGRSEPKQK
jgi:hypothetical protein